MSSFSNIHNAFCGSFFNIDESVFPTEPDIVKVHKITLFMTRFSDSGSSSSFSNLHNAFPVGALYVYEFIFPTEPHIMKVHKVTLLTTRDSSTERHNSFRSLHNDCMSRCCLLRLWVHFYHSKRLVPCCILLWSNIGQYYPHPLRLLPLQLRHMSVIAFQFTGNSTVCSAVNSRWHEKKHQSSALLAFLKWIYCGPVDFPLQRASNIENVSMSRRLHVNNTCDILRIPYFQFNNPKIWVDKTHGCTGNSRYNHSKAPLIARLPGPTWAHMGPIGPRKCRHFVVISSLAAPEFVILCRTFCIRCVLHMKYNLWYSETCL